MWLSGSDFHTAEVQLVDRTRRVLAQTFGSFHFLGSTLILSLGGHQFNYHIDLLQRNYDLLSLYQGGRLVLSDAAGTYSFFTATV